MNTLNTLNAEDRDLVVKFARSACEHETGLEFDNVSVEEQALYLDEALAIVSMDSSVESAVEYADLDEDVAVEYTGSSGFSYYGDNYEIDVDS